MAWKAEWPPMCHWNCSASLSCETLFSDSMRETERVRILVRSVSHVFPREGRHCTMP